MMTICIRALSIFSTSADCIYQYFRSCCLRMRLIYRLPPFVARLCYLYLLLLFMDPDFRFISFSIINSLHLLLYQLVILLQCTTSCITHKESSHCFINFRIYIFCRQILNFLFMHLITYYSYLMSIPNPYARNPSVRSANLGPTLPYFEPSFMMGQNKPGPRSERSFDMNSVQSFNAVQGSVKNSVISYNSGPRRSEKSIISNYPPMISKDISKLSQQSFMQQSQIDQRKSLNKPIMGQAKVIEDKNAKKSKTNYYIDEDYFYSSQFKRNFVKGMLALSKNKNINEMSLLLKELAPTIMVRSEDTSLWVAAFLIIFKIENKLRKGRTSEEDLLEMIEDELVDYMLKNRDLKKARIIKIVVYIFKELPIYRPKVIQWFEEFVRKNKDRLSQIDLSKFVDTATINPPLIDYSSMNKNAIIKLKQAEKQKEKQKKKQIEKQKQKQAEADKQRKQKQQQKQKIRKNSQLSISISRAQNLQKQSQKADPKQQRNKQKQQNIKRLNIKSQQQQIQQQRVQPNPELLGKDPKQRDVTKKASINNNSSNNSNANQISNNTENARLSQANNTQAKNQISNNVTEEKKLSLQQMISRRIQSAFPNSGTQKIKVSNNQQKQNKVQKNSNPQIPEKKTQLKNKQSNASNSMNTIQFTASKQSIKKKQAEKNREPIKQIEQKQSMVKSKAKQQKRIEYESRENDEEEYYISENNYSYNDPYQSNYSQMQDQEYSNRYRQQQVGQYGFQNEQNMGSYGGTGQFDSRHNGDYNYNQNYSQNFHNSNYMGQGHYSEEDQNEDDYNYHQYDYQQ